MANNENIPTGCAPEDYGSLPACGGCAYSPNKTEEKPPLPHDIKKVIAVVSGKGGVGKSTVCALLASALRRRGFEIGVLDADITGPSIPHLFGVKQKAMGDGTHILPSISHNGIKVMSINLMLEDETAPVVWRGPVISGVVEQFWNDVAWGELDLLLVDMPPGTGDVPLTTFQKLPIDGIVVVTTPQDLVGMIVKKAVTMAEMMKVPVLGLVENMASISCPDCDKRIYPFGEGKAQRAADDLGIPLLAQLPIVPENAALADKGKIEMAVYPDLDPAVSHLVGLLK